MVERNKQTYIYKQINKTDGENKQQSINIAGIHLNGKIIKLSLISNGTYLNRYNTINARLIYFNLPTVPYFTYDNPSRRTQ